MTILITGGAGFLGSHLVDALAGRGEQIIIFDDLSGGKRENISYHLHSKNVNFVQGSILDPDLLEPLISRSSLVYHLAAIVGLERVCPDPERALIVNIEGTRNVLELCRRGGVKTMIASSSETYGKNESVPLREGSDTVLGDTSVPRWAYAVSKLADEHLARSMMNDIPITIVRFFNSYGPRVLPIGGSGVVARFIEQAFLGEPLTIFGDGTQRRSYTFVDDSIDGTIAAMEMSAGEIFNIGFPKETSINDLAELIINFTGSSSTISHGPNPKNWGLYEETGRRLPDISKAETMLGFKPAIGLREGLIRTMEWMWPRLEKKHGKKIA